MQALHQAPEHEFEAAHGLPEPLPKGEKLLWQGSPDPWMLARRVFHIRKLGLYFVALLAWQAAVPLAGRWAEPVASAAAGPTAKALPQLVWMGLLATVALGLVAALAWLVARTAAYTLTDQRIVMRIGVVLTVTYNLPLKRIEAAELRPLSHGHGDIALTLEPRTRIAYAHLWPHARPWRVAQPQPMLRCVPDGAAVAQRISQAWQLANHQANAQSAVPATQAEAPSSPVGTMLAHG